MLTTNTGMVSWLPTLITICYNGSVPSAKEFASFLKDRGVKGLDGQVIDSFDIFLQTGFSPWGIFPLAWFDKTTSVGNQGS